MEPFWGPALHNIFLLSHAKTRSISAENPTGEKGKGGMATEGAGARAARDLGQGWKVSPCITLPARTTVTLAEIQGPGTIQHIWNTVHPDWWRRLVFRAYWDDEPTPSIETPLGDFFCNGWCRRCNVNSLPIAVNPAGGFNSYWPMPFRQSARITIENLWDEDCHGYYYQITYALTEVPEDAGYLHAQFRRSNPLPYKQVHTLLDGVQGQGHYVGTYLAWQVNNNGWWGEGEMKFYLDGDGDFATIVGTGTEDYFGGAWNFEHPPGQYGVYSTPFLGMPQVIMAGEGGMYQSQQRHGMYRWHIPDPIRFENDIRVTIQALGWRSGGRYLPLQDDISSTVWWYQREPHAPFPPLPDRDGLEVI
ncbi:MAG TPA: glycoside hydrolase family 172 protein [Chthonomonas sp.]|uniref:glycoside hydrolase family 172 protein n=1 Tax=Chthonomonas sp. TaxID=2282153 RepID=UPI002B4B5261|nr:glycoside hydrolase family 172 protein [Chthonomonas sp.]HLI47770.1 glycoside hydrolase family 172 protein [Chthonomonas sp.]